MIKVKTDKWEAEIDLAKLRYKQDEYDALTLCLDKAGIPNDIAGKELSLWGRVCILAGIEIYDD